MINIPPLSRNSCVLSVASVTLRDAERQFDCSEYKHFLRPSGSKRHPSGCRAVMRLSPSKIIWYRLCDGMYRITNPDTQTSRITNSRLRKNYNFTTTESVFTFELRSSLLPLNKVDASIALYSLIRSLLPFYFFTFLLFYLFTFLPLKVRFSPCMSDANKTSPMPWLGQADVLVDELELMRGEEMTTGVGDGFQIVVLSTDGFELDECRLAADVRKESLG